MYSYGQDIWITKSLVDFLMIILILFLFFTNSSFTPLKRELYYVLIASLKSNVYFPVYLTVALTIIYKK